MGSSRSRWRGPLASTATSRPPGFSLASACSTCRLSPRSGRRSTRRRTTGRSAWRPPDSLLSPRQNLDQARPGAARALRGRRHAGVRRAE
jgi:hypothetical protein